MPKAIRFAPSLAALLLGCSALCSSAQAGWFSSDPKPAAAQKDDKAAPVSATNLEESIHQAQMLRLAGNYAEAINHLSQLMLVAADDPRVVSEYGKTLVSMGRPSEAQKFLTRAQQLQPDDWSVCSALGVAYDQIGNQKDAQDNYEHALKLKPGDAGVLSNYALSRMLAKDPVMARQLADRAEAANASIKDDKIARNIAMIRSMAPQANIGLAANTPAPIPGPAAAPHVAVAAAPLAPVQPATPVTKPAPLAVASAAPHPLAANPAPTPVFSPAPSHLPNGVVMQAVPVDPLAGPVDSKSATHAPRSLQFKAPSGSEAPPVKTVAKADVPKVIEPAKPAVPAESVGAKAQTNKTLAKSAPIAQAKTETPKPAAMAQAKADVAKPVAKSEPAKAEPAKTEPVKIAPAKTEVAKAEPVKATPAKAEVAKAEPAKTMPAKTEVAKATPAAAPAVKVSLPLKAADVKSNAAPAAPKVLPATPVKAADAKAQPIKTAAKPKDAIPDLRLSANAF